MLSFTGTLSSTLGDFPAFFLPPNPIVPATPPSIAPAIDLGFLLNIGDSLSLSGPIYAWDDPFEVGTWTVTITAINAVPEPATALLLMGALGGLALTRRRYAQTNPLG